MLHFVCRGGPFRFRPPGRPAPQEGPAIDFIPQQALQVDAQTLRDLDLFATERNPAGVFEWLDTTRTRGGRAMLRALLRHPRARVEEIRSVQETLAFLSEPGQRARVDVRATDRRLRTVANYLESYVSILPGRLDPAYLIRALWTMMSYRKYFEQISAGVRNLHRLLQSVERFVADTEPFDTAGTLPSWLGAYRAFCVELLERPTLQRFLREGPGGGSFGFWKIYLYDAEFRRTHRTELERLLEICHELDALRALGRAVERHALVFPRFVDAVVDARFVARPPEPSPTGGEGGDAPGPTPQGVGSHAPLIRVEGLAHPLVEAAVANDASLGRAAHFLFLTGPNMAGKTTYMKALGLAVYLAHVGMGVSARAMELRSFQGICSSLNVEDNLAHGYSFYLAEVRRVRTVGELLQKGLRLLVLFDELFKGTNVRDALDGSRLVIEGFRGWPESIFVLSSHLLELADEIPANGGLVFRCFEASVYDGRPRFTYRLRDGVSTHRLGMLILENEGIPRLLERPETGGDRVATETS